MADVTEELEDALEAMKDLRMFDASDPVQVNNKRRSSARTKKADEEVLKHLLKTPQGRAWYWRLLEACHCFQTSFVQGDASASAFREGERNIGLRLLAEMMRADPQAYMHMVKENANE